MASVNKVIVLGNLGKDPEVRFTQGGDPVCNFSMATTEKWKDKSGEQQERTEWHRVTAFGRTAEIVGEYLHKGSSCYVEGRLQTREYEKDGIKRYTTEIVVDRLVLLGSPSGERRERTEERPSSNGQRKPPPKSQGDFDDSIPF